MVSDKPQVEFITKDEKKPSARRAIKKSVFFNHVAGVMKRLLELEYQIRVFKELFPEVFKYIKSFRGVILDNLRSMHVSETTINKLKLVDGAYDYIQMEQLNLSIDFLHKMKLPQEISKTVLDKLSCEFLDGLNDADPIHSWSQQKKDLIFSKKMQITWSCLVYIYIVYINYAYRCIGQGLVLL